MKLRKLKNGNNEKWRRIMTLLRGCDTLETPRVVLISKRAKKRNTKEGTYYFNTGFHLP